jgi:SAM-dependent methyltransferase
MLARARRRLGRMNVSFLQADLTNPWRLAQVFDVIMANLVLEHVKDLTRVFAEAHHVLRPGGLLYMSELHPYKQLQGSQEKYRDTAMDAEVLVPAFRHSLSEYINAGIEAGFTLCRIGEWQNESDAAPRLMTLLFERP